jgi:hypothetical protein
MTSQEPEKDAVPASASSDSVSNTARPGWRPPLPETLPKPTVQPAVLAFGACLLALGVVTSWIISGVGIVMFAIGIAGWIAEMRREQQE